MEPAPIVACEAIKVLTLGDGDLSFSLALSRCFGNALHLTATTLVGSDELVHKYQGSNETLSELSLRGVTVCHGVDACLPPPCISQQDVIIFNFPHLGDTPEDGASPSSAHVKAHQALIAHFLAAARQRLVAGGQVHITLCGEQPALWNLLHAATRVGLAEVQRQEPTCISAFLSPGRLQRLKELICSPESGWAAPRKWRNGALGCVHWASRYGYQHRRHESAQTMRVEHSLTFIFEASTDSFDPVLEHTPEGNSENAKTEGQMGEVGEYEKGVETEKACDGICRSQVWCCLVCGQYFESELALKCHAESPAKPLVSSYYSFAAQRQTCGGDRESEPASSNCKLQSLTQRESSSALYSIGKGDSVEVGGTDASCHRFEVPQSGNGCRFLAFARKHAFPSLLISKAYAQRALDNGELRLNGELVEETRFLKMGDLLELKFNQARHRKDAAIGAAQSLTLIATATRSKDNLQARSSCCNLDVVQSECPSDVAIIWKPAGMRSLGEHPGTLQSCLPLLTDLSCTPKSRPISRLEIGCAGLSLVALTCDSQLQYTALASDNLIWHTFLATVHGRIGDVGDRLLFVLPHAGAQSINQSVGNSSDWLELSHEQALEPQPGLKVDCRVVHLNEPVTSTLEITTPAYSGKCCAFLCHLLRQRGNPVVGDRFAQHARANAPSHLKGSKLQLECVGINTDVSIQHDGVHVRVRHKHGEVGSPSNHSATAAPWT